jgi:hypothetical protein
MALEFIFVTLALVAFVHPDFDYHKREEVAKIGPVSATIDKPQRATIPTVVAAALLIAGTVLIVLGPRIK